VAAAFLAACAGSRSEAPAAAVAHSEVPVVPGTATLYVLNTGEPTFVISSNIVYDGQKQLVTVSEGRYAVALLYGGRHVLSCAGMPAVAPVVLDAVPGQTYYLNTYLGARNTNQICTLLPPDLGQKALARIKSAHR